MKTNKNKDLATDVQATSNLCKSLATVVALGEQTGQQNAKLRNAFYSGESNRPSQLSYQDFKKLEKAKDIEQSREPVRGKFGKEQKFYRATTPKGMEEMKKIFQKQVPRVAYRTMAEFFDLLRIASIFFSEDEVLDLLDRRLEALEEETGVMPISLSSQRQLLRMYWGKREISPFLCGKLGKSEENAPNLSESGALDILFPEDIVDSYDEIIKIKNDFERVIERHFLFKLREQLKGKLQTSDDDAPSSKKGPHYNE